jgi:hypothetical protein
METFWIASRNDWWVLRIIPCWPNLDSRASRGYNDAVECRVAAEILVSVGSNDIEPDDGVGTQPSMTPVPAGYIIGEWLNTPVLRI